jgi:hypothetical protein
LLTSSETSTAITRRTLGASATHSAQSPAPISMNVASGPRNPRRTPIWSSSIARRARASTFERSCGWSGTRR